MSAAEELNAEQIDELRLALEAAREELDRALEASEEGTRTVGLDEPIGRLTRMDALQQQSMAKAGRRSVESRLGLVAAALASIEKGDYGICADCDEPIGFTRLRARPETLLCLACQERRESRRR